MEGTGGQGTPCSSLLRGGIAAIVVATAVGCAQTPGAVPERDVEATSKGAAKSSDPPLEAERPALRAWFRLGFGAADETRIYRTLFDMTHRAPVVVYAAVEDVAPGRVYGLQDGPDAAFQAVRIDVRVQEAIVGQSFKQGDLIPLELGLLPYGTDVESKMAEMVGDEGLFFLLRSGDAQPEFDILAVPEEQKLGLYHTTSPQGLLLNDRGRVRVGRYFGSDFPANLDGKSFSELLESVRSIAR